jgi:hypothetical protein
VGAPWPRPPPPLIESLTAVSFSSITSFFASKHFFFLGNWTL